MIPVYYCEICRNYGHSIRAHQCEKCESFDHNSSNCPSRNRHLNGYVNSSSFAPAFVSHSVPILVSQPTHVFVRHPPVHPLYVSNTNQQYLTNNGVVIRNEVSSRIVYDVNGVPYIERRYR